MPSIIPVTLLAIVFASLLVVPFTFKKSWAPEKSSQARRYLIVVIAMGSVGAYYFYLQTPEKLALANADKFERAKKTASDQASCEADQACVGANFQVRATAACRPKVERLSNYQFEWTDGTFEQKFPSYYLKNSDVLTYYGNKIKLQNGFGAWSFYTYHCDYNFRTGEVVDVRAQQGR